MLFLAVTNSPLKHINTKYAFQWGEKYLACSWDNLLGSFQKDSNSARVTEKGSNKSSLQDELAGISIDYAERKIQIDCPIFGGRPLYYHHDQKSDQFFCSTHLHQLKRAGVIFETDPARFAEFLVYRCVMPPNTLIRKVQQIMLGGRVTISCTDRKLAIKELPPDLPRQDIDESLSTSSAAETICDELGQCLQRNATKHSHVLLSGGIDSSIIYRIAQDRMGIKRSYSSGYPFEDPDLDIEKEYALSAAKLFSADHIHYVPTVERYQAAIIQGIADSELPLHHLQSPLMYLLSRDCFESKTESIVNGVGAGGTFGNFRNFLFKKHQFGFKLFERPAGQFLLRQIYHYTGRGKYLLHHLKESSASQVSPCPQDPLWRWHEYGNIPWVQKHLGVDLAQIVAGPMETLSSFEFDSIENLWAMYSLLGDETTTLNIWSKLGEATGRSTLFPMYSPQVLQTAMKLSWSKKLATPENRLRKSIGKLCQIPDRILNRTKSGFGIKKEDWALPGGVFDPLLPIAGQVVGADCLRNLQSRDRTIAMLFWNLLNYGIWCRLVVDEEPVERLLNELKDYHE